MAYSRIGVSSNGHPTVLASYIGVAADTKPTGIPIGSTFYERDTGVLYVTYDGTNWARRN